MFQSLTWLFLTTVSEIKNSVICRSVSSFYCMCRLGQRFTKGMNRKYFHNRMQRTIFLLAR